MSTLTIAAAECDYCGLPLPRPLFGGDREDRAAGPRYCCSGCRFAHAITQERGAEGAASWTLTSLGLSIFFSMSVMVFTIALWSFDVYAAAPGDDAALRNAFGGLLRWLALIFSVPVLLLLGKPLADDAWKNLRRGVLSADLLLLTGVLAAFAYSTWSVLWEEGAIYFETGCVILVFVTLGRWLAATGKLRTTEALDSLQKLLPAAVRRVTPDGDLSVPLDDVAPGDVLQVLAGERIPIDGLVLHGTAAVDEQVFTGESVPVDRHAGDRVFAGTLNLDGTIRLRATSLPRQGAFGALLAAVQLAREAKGRYQTAADRWSRLFFPIITAIAAATILGHGLTQGWAAGWLAGLAVVLIACPCALALATPLAVWAALGRAARRGVLFRSGEAIEQLAEVRAVRFDKTGTLTTGTPRVMAVHIDRETDAEALRRRTAALVRCSTHVFSQAIARELDATGDGAELSDAVRTVPGCGVEARLPGESTPLRLGRWDWLCASGAQAAVDSTLSGAYQQVQAAGHSVVGVAWGRRLRGLYVIAEEIRPAASGVLRQLVDDGYDVALLTGDHSRRASRLAEELGVPALAGLSPEAKAIEVRLAREQLGLVAMVGDGINDAPALAAADVGIALGCGTDVTRDSADVCLLSDDLAAIPWTLDLARETVRTIRGNLAWAFGYNAVGVVFAAAGWLHPAIAAALMVASSLVVISRSLRLGSDAGASDSISPADDAAQSADDLPAGGVHPGGARVTTRHPSTLASPPRVEAAT